MNRLVMTPSSYRTEIYITDAAHKELQTLHLDRHFHPYGLQFFVPFFGKRGMHCEKGQVHTFKIARVIANYTSDGSLCYLLFPIWNAVRAIFGKSDWEVACDSILEKVQTNASLNPKFEEVLNQALELNQESWPEKPLKEPQRCNLVLH